MRGFETADLPDGDSATVPLVVLGHVLPLRDPAAPARAILVLPRPPARGAAPLVLCGARH